MIGLADRGERVVRFLEQTLRHVKGEKANDRFVLEPWQRTHVRRIYGDIDERGRRRIRTAALFVARKNGKTSLAAGLALYHLTADGEMGAEVYSAAADTLQARLCFDVAAAMAKASPMLSRICVVQKYAITVPATGSVYRALSSEVPTKEGLNPSAVVFDELHAQRDRALWDVLGHGMVSRVAPLMIALSTAGFNRHSICYQVWKYALEVQRGERDDPSFYSAIYAAEDGDDWRDERVWLKANPNLGVSVQLEALRIKAAEARLSLASESVFRRYHLNQWVEQEIRFLDMSRYDGCPSELPDLEFRPCYGGLDLSSTHDLTSFVLVFPLDDGEVAVRAWFWIPEDGVAEKEHQDNVPYSQWHRDGLLRYSPGNTIRHENIRAEINDIGRVFNVVEIGVDPWQASQLERHLRDDGFDVHKVKQNYSDLSSATKHLERLILEGRLNHGGNPVMRWCATNLAVKLDQFENVIPSKAKSTQRIDGVVALIMGLARAGDAEQVVSDASELLI